MNKESTPVTRCLDELGIPYRFFRHPGAVHSLVQAARERGQKPEQVVRSVLFRLAQDEYVMALMAGPHQVSWPALRRHLGRSRLTMASEEEVLAVTGYPLGAVSPIGLSAPLRILVDRSLMDQTEISIGSGERYSTVIMAREDLFKLLGEVEIGEFGEQ